MTTLKDAALAAYEDKRAKDIRKAQEAIETARRLDEEAWRLLRARISAWISERFGPEVLSDPRLVRDAIHPTNRAHLTTPDGIVLHFQMPSNGDLICWAANASGGTTYVRDLAQLGLAISTGYGVV